LNYQWRRNGTNLNDGGIISGTSSNTLTLAGVGLADATNYDVVVFSSFGRATSSVAFLTVYICPSFSWTPPALPSALVGTPYNQSISASGGTAPYTYSVTSGSLPAGLSLSPGGVLSGTPSAGPGVFNFTVTATDFQTCTGSYGFSLTVNTPTVANSDSLQTLRNTPLTINPAFLLSNDVAGSGNGLNTNLTLISLSPTSSNGGNVQVSSGVASLWTNHYNGPGGNSYDQSYAVAVDSGNNVVVSGYSTEGGGPSIHYDYTTIKYSSAGTPLWTNFYGLETTPLVSPSLNIDRNDNIFLLADTTNGLNSDYLLIKYSSVGAALWTNRYNGPANDTDYPVNITTDQGGKVFITGDSTGSGTGLDFATIAYSSGGAPLWTNRFNGLGNGDDYGAFVLVDGAGNVYVAGDAYNSASNYDLVIIKYSSAGVSLRTNVYDGLAHGDDFIAGLALDASTNLYVTATSFNGTDHEFVTIKYSFFGVPLWTNHYDAPEFSEHYASGLALDKSGNVIILGDTYSPSNAHNYVTLAYSGSGTPLWTNLYDGSQHLDDYPTALAVDAAGNACVTGYSYGAYDADFATIKYSSNGVPLWTNRYDGGIHGDDFPYGLAVDGGGNVVVTGYGYSPSGADYDYATIKYGSTTNMAYVPPLNFTGTDTLTYVIQDSLGMMATGTVSVLVYSPIAPVATIISASGVSASIAFTGTPGVTYNIEASTNLPSTWTPLGTRTAVTNGTFQFTDTNTAAYPVRFYRAVYRP
jgi:hypothetical protein